jgi:hypothetical protein
MLLLSRVSVENLQMFVKKTTAEWGEKLCALMDGHELKDVANCDETGLFFQALPNKPLCLKGDTCSGGKG